MTTTEDNPEALKEAMGELSTDAPKEKPVSTAKKKTKTAAEKPAKKKTVADDPNVVTLKDLAGEFKLTTTAARRKLRDAGLKAEGRWKWEKDSRDLDKARKALEAEDEDEKE